MMHIEQVTVVKTVIGTLISHEVPYIHQLDNEDNFSYFILVHNEDSNTTFTLDTWKEGIEYILSLLSTWNDGMAHTFFE